MRNPIAEEKIRSIETSKVPYEIERSGLRLTITKNVYPTSELSELLVDVMDDPVWGIQTGMQVLDYGTGTGFLAIQAARRGAAVTASDLNQDAIFCAKLNASKMHVESSIDFRCGENLDVIDPTEQFSRVFAGMPWDDDPANTILERSLYDPGFVMRMSLLQNIRRICSPGGCVLMSSHEEHQRHYPEAYPPDLNFVPIRERTIKGVVHWAVLVTPK